MLLISVLILGAALLTIGMAFGLRAIGEIALGSAEETSERALLLTDGCMEEALLRLLRDASYPGGSFTLPAGACSAIVTGNPADTEVTVTSTVALSTHVIHVRVETLGARLIVTDWRLLQ